MTSWKRRLAAATRSTDAATSELARLIPEHVQGDDRKAAMALISLAWANDTFTTQLRLYQTAEIFRITKTVEALTVDVVTDDVGLFDRLTNLPTRPVMQERLSHELRKARRTARMVAVIVVDLDGLHKINERHGSAVGDRLVCDAGRALLATLRPGDSVTRVGGDEFVAISPDLTTTADAMSIAERVRSAVEHLSGDLARVTASVGITLGSEEDTVDGLLHRAETAMRNARSAGGNQVQLFGSSTGTDTERRVVADRRLRNALDADAVPVHYRAGFHIDATNDIVMIEARLDTDRLGRAADLSVAAASPGLQSRVAIEVLRRAAVALVGTTGQGPDGPVLVLPVRPLLVAHDRFRARVRETLESSGLPAGRLCFSVPERVLSEHRGDVQAAMAALRSAGMVLMVEDFSCGLIEARRLAESPIGSVALHPDVVDALIEGEGRGLMDRLAGRTLTIVAGPARSEVAIDRFRAAGVDVVHGSYLDPVGWTADLGEVLARAGTRFSDRVSLQF